jgi:hypothetical protein
LGAGVHWGRHLVNLTHAGCEVVGNGSKVDWTGD